MSHTEISHLIISKETSFLELYGRYTLATKRYYDYSAPRLFKQLLVVCEDAKLCGIIGEKEILSAAKRAECTKLCAADILNADFTYLYDNIDYKKAALDLFCNCNFNNIPIVSHDTHKPIDIVTRWEFIELRMLSFAEYGEDIILNYVLFDVDDLFYIDVGAYDPWEDSVTKWFYSSRRGRGINIEPQKAEFEKLVFDRSDDINIQAALGEEAGELQMYGNMGIATAVPDYAVNKKDTFTVAMTTLKEVCNTHIKKGIQIHFLKIDAEGYEKQVLLGADFVKFRPWIIMIESTAPLTDNQTYDKWEHILLSNKYIFAKQYGINRIYVASEHKELLNRFIELEDMKRRLIISIPNNLRRSE